MKRVHNPNITKKSAILSITFGILSGISFNMVADDYVVVGRNAKIFDSPNVKSYVTLNSKNQEVTLIPGMALKKLESNNGWHMVEYSPGLRGFLSVQSTANGLKIPESGSYPIRNIKNKQLKVSCKENIWKAETDNKIYKGKLFNNIVIFFNDKNQPAYSLVELEDGIIAISYDNAVTKFF